MGLAVDPRTDLYALGVMLYQMASGRVPFDAQLTGTMLLAHAHEIPTPILTRAPDLPAALARLIMELLEKDPDARPASAAEVAARLDACLPGARPRWRSALGARWLVVIATALAVAAALAYVVVR